ncbi:hypothetical protein ACR42D_10135 [Desulfovibrio caledoniensis]
MDKTITELEARKKHHSEQARLCDETIRKLQALCDHPSWEDDGHDSHYSYKRCSRCGKRAQR